MNRRSRMSMVALVLFAAYCVLIAVVAVVASNVHDSAFWLEIGVIILLSAGALWLSRRIYRRAK